MLRWSPDARQPFREIVRQQWNFGPPSAQREVEEYPVELSNVGAFELIMIPKVSGGDARASLKNLRLFLTHDSAVASFTGILRMPARNPAHLGL